LGWWGWISFIAGAGVVDGCQVGGVTAQAVREKICTYLNRSYYFHRMQNEDAVTGFLDDSEELLYDIVLSFLSELNIHGFIDWVSDGKEMVQYLIPEREIPGSERSKRTFFTLLQAIEVRAGMKNLLRQYFDLISEKRSSSIDATELLVNFLLTSRADEKWTDLGWCNTFIDVNRLDGSDGLSVVHHLAGLPKLSMAQMHAALRKFSNIVVDAKLPGENTPVFKVRCTPDLSIQTPNGQYPIEIAISCGNTAFLTYFNIQINPTIPIGLNEAKKADESESLKQEILDILDEFGVLLQEAKEKIK
jgi:hypothetical protein